MTGPASGPANGPTVLVTGASGFVGAHTIIHLLEHGYRVRGTVRAPEREAAVLEMVKLGGGAPDDGNLEFAVADLTRDADWDAAVDGCEFVLHVASPFPGGVPAHEDDLIVPARDGTLRVLRAARDAGARRVVMTSSFGAVGYSPKPAGEAYTEEDWTQVDQPGIGAYVKSKTVAERAAWYFAANESGTTELAVVNPVGIFGPVLGPDYSSSVELVRRLLSGAMPVVPRMFFGIVDVRDVAALHLLAMTSPAAAGQRFIAVAETDYGLPAMARLLRDRLGADGARVSTRVIPDWAVRAGARLPGPLGRQLKAVVPQVGRQKTISNDKARRVLGWHPRAADETVLATARSLLALDGNPRT